MHTEQTRPRLPYTYGTDRVRLMSGDRPLPCRPPRLLRRVISAAAALQELLHRFPARDRLGVDKSMERRLRHVERGSGTTAAQLIACPRELVKRLHRVQVDAIASVSVVTGHTSALPGGSAVLRTAEPT